MSPTQSSFPQTGQAPELRETETGRNHGVHGAIRSAADRTEVDFDYLLAQARIESGLDPSAQATTSSATGLFQFIERTWLGTLQKYGAQHGYGWAAASIETDNGRPVVRDPKLRAQILELRNDPQAASLMAGEFASENASYLARQFGRAPDETELYLAHFLGPNGAARFITAHRADPSRQAAALFADAAAANRAIFYDKGRPRSLGEVRDGFARKLDRAKASGGSGDFYAPHPKDRFASATPAWRDETRAAESSGPHGRSMAQVLRETFGEGHGLGPRASHQVASAYAAFERFGL